MVFEYLEELCNERNHMAKLFLGNFTFFNSDAPFFEHNLLKEAATTNYPQALYNLSMAELGLYKSNGITILHNIFQQQQPSKKVILQCRQVLKNMLTKKAIDFIP